jgi:ribosome biogenesis GTPase
MGIDEIKALTAQKTTVFAGPSGVGKSSLLNVLNPYGDVATGELSEKIKRGKHTTRHSELMYVGDSTFIMDTPGFSSLEVFDTEPEELKNYYSEFEAYEEECRFNGCVHINEPDCGVKNALAEGSLSRLRYDNYRQIYDELKSKRKW